MTTNNCLQIDIVDNGRGGHKDLHFSVEGLFEKRIFDTYYFAIAIEPYETFQEIKNAVASLFTYWLEEIRSAKDYDFIYLPIDFSDQYTGCLEVHKVGEVLQLRYGWSHREGYTVSPLNPGSFSKTVSDFEDTENRAIEIPSSQFLSSIIRLIEKLHSKNIG